MRKLCMVAALCVAASNIVAVNRIEDVDERQTEYNIRLLASFFQTLRQAKIDVENLNPDEQNIADYAGSFSKTLEHNSTTGILTPNGQLSFLQLTKAMLSGEQADFNAIQRAPGAAMKLVGPQSAMAFTLQGRDSSLLLAPMPPLLDSAQAAAEILELYWMELCRDVKFEEFGTGTGSDNAGEGESLTAQAASVMQTLGDAYKGPRNESVVDASVIFRGANTGSVTGPYVSQFMLIDLHRLNHPKLPEKQYIPVAQKREFGVSWDDFITLQNGVVPKPYLSTDFDGQRYPITMRDVATYVHFDADNAYGPYFSAVNILMLNGFPLSPLLPYYNGSMPNEAAYPVMGGADVACTMAGAAIEGLKTAWMNKWRSYRRLRPEALAGLIHRAVVTETNPYGLHESIFELHAGIDTLQRVHDHNALQATAEYDPNQFLTPEQAETYLLSLVYPEGCPPHPSYPAGHAVLAGSCVTVIKAFFNDTVLISSRIAPVKPDPSDPTALVALSGEGEDAMTVAGELDKFASNIATARNMAGIHYRTDGDDGVLLGERVAIAYLQDQVRKYQEEGFTAFELTKFNGQRIRITAENVEIIS